MYKPTKLLNRYFVFVWIVSLALGIGQSLFNSTITVFANAHGYSNTFAGSLSIGYLLGALGGRVVGGYCTDYRTRREGMIIGTAAFLAATVLFCLPVGETGPGMMLLRLLHGFGFGCATTAFYVAAVDVAPKEKEPVALGINFTSQSVSYMLVTLLLSLFVTGDSYKLLFIVTAVIVAGSVVFGAAANYERGEAQRPAGKKQKNGLFEPGALPYASLIIIFDGALTLPLFYVIPLAASKGLISGGNHIFVFVGIGMFAGYLILPRIAHRFGSLAGMLPAYILGLTGHLILIYTNSNVFFSLAGMFYGVIVAALPVMQNATVNRLPEDRKGAGTATLNAALDLTLGVGPLLWGILIDHIGFSIPFLAGAVMYVAAFVVNIFVSKWERATLKKYGG